MNLNVSGTGADDIGWAEQAVTISAQYVGVQHILKLEVIAAPSDRIEFRVGSASTGDQILEDTLVEAGYRCIGFVPTSTTFYVQFRNRGNFREKTVQIDNISILSLG